MTQAAALSNRFPETRKDARSVRFWPTVTEARAIPALGNSEPITPEAALFHLKYTEPGAAYYVAELDPETGRAYGYIDTGDAEGDSWGIFSLVDLEKRKVPVTGQDAPGAVERTANWNPTPAYVAVPAMAEPADTEAADPQAVPQPAPVAAPAPQAAQAAQAAPAAPAAPVAEADKPSRYRLGRWGQDAYSLAKHLTKQQIGDAMRALVWTSPEAADETTRAKITTATGTWKGFAVGRIAAHPITDRFTLYAVEDTDDTRRAYLVGNSDFTGLLCSAIRAAA